MPATRPPEARPATPAELAVWTQFKRYYEQTLTPAVRRASIAAQIASRAQQWANARGRAAYVFGPNDQKVAEGILWQFNLYGRIIQAVESSKYFIRLRGGDLDILADPRMHPSEYQADRMTPEQELEGFGAFPLIPIAIWVLKAGVVLVAGILAAAAYTFAAAEKQKAETDARIVDLDHKMTKAPAAQKKAWADFKKQNKDDAKKSGGLLTKLFGESGATAFGGALGIGLIALAGFWLYSMSQKKKTPSEDRILVREVEESIPLQTFGT